jgi:metallo-beta-lactamase class B
MKRQVISTKQAIKNGAIAFTFLCLLGLNCGAQGTKEALPEGKHSIRPFHIIGNIYYVGLDDNTSFLITSPQGHILLDMPYEAGVPYVRKNIEALGFNVKDVKYLLNAHAHVDHVGGLAAYKELTGGKVLVMAEDVPSISNGGKTDYRNKDGREQWTPVKVDEVLKDKSEVSLGGNVLVAHLTPGHTKGCTTWTTVAEEKGKKYNVVFVCSVGMSGIGINTGVLLLNNSIYPTIAEDFARSFKILKTLPVDVFLASHGSFFRMEEKIKRMEAGAGFEAWISPQGYKGYLAESEEAYMAELARERAHKSSSRQ